MVFYIAFLSALVALASTATLPAGSSNGQVSTPVAFTAALHVEGGCFVPAAGTVVPYNHVILNHGEGFSSTSHKFVAPVRGLYSITVNAMTCWSRHARTELRLVNNGQLVLTVRSRVEEVFGYNGNSQTVTLHLEQGSELWVEIVNQGDSLMGNANNDNTFSGFLYAEL